MKVQKSILFSLITIIFFGVIAFLIFWVPSFFVEEFSYVNINFTNNILNVSTVPDDLFEKSVSRWTDVSANFRNESQNTCIVVLKSAKLDKNFNLNPGSEYGIILPKKEDIIITFCEVQKTIRVN
ncbi:hypothetical protein C4546_04695 [Candidatus Parcubacteria bacterium]|jgi:hypothetical protein|nr:MAG: hypothetical protein C4546_04695 [Candidatus Parcubacteria bacterium]